MGNQRKHLQNAPQFLTFQDGVGRDRSDSKVAAGSRIDPGIDQRIVAKLHLPRLNTSS